MPTTASERAATSVRRRQANGHRRHVLWLHPDQTALLDHYVQAGRFRDLADLVRSVLPVQVPPLRTSPLLPSSAGSRRPRTCA